MRVTKVAIFGFVLSCFVAAVPTWGVLIQPSNISPEPVSDCNVVISPGGLFSFDFVISDMSGLTREAQGFQAIISVSGPGGLTGDEPNSVAVADELAYWLYGNSAPVFIDHGDDSYTFGDNPFNGVAQSLSDGDILARYAFTWDGTVGYYTFTIDLDTDSSFILLEDFITKEALQFTPGPCPGDDSSFTVHIPEPATLILLALGGFALLRKRRA